MAEQNNGRRREAGGKSVAESLDSLNAELRQQGARTARRYMEATVEKKARRRRSREQPVSAAFKKV